MLKPHLTWRSPLLLAACLCASLAQAGEVMVAVAANFTSPMQQIAPAFEKASGHLDRDVLRSRQVLRSDPAWRAI